jgi:hypothetical protein
MIAQLVAAGRAFCLGEVSAEPPFGPRWGAKQLLEGIFVSLDCQDVLYETENAFSAGELGIGAKRFTEAYSLSAVCSRLSLDREFLFLAISARGANSPTAN